MVCSQSRSRIPSNAPLPVSQFTLLASTKKGSKPDFHGALGGDEAKELYQLFVEKVQKGYVNEKVKDGVFQAMMVRLFIFVFGKEANFLLGSGTG